MKKKTLVVYETLSGKEPFTEWLRSLDRTLHLKVLVRLERVVFGNLGDHKYLSDGVSELRFREGLRIYYTEVRGEIILLLAGGDKNTKRDQNKDIEKAKEYLEEFRRDSNG